MRELFILIFIVQDVYGHGRLRNPPSRASMWREGFDNPPDYSDNQGFCGGASVSNTEKVSALRAKRVTFLKTKKTFLSLINSFEFLQILGIYRIKKNQKELSRGKNISPKVSKVIDSL